MSGSVLTGDMGSIPLPDILMLLNGNRKTGRLCCSRAGVSKTVEYEAGDVVFARSTLPEDRLGAYLLAHGKVTKQQLQKAGPKVDSQVRLGKTLVRLGILTPSALWEAVQGQVLEIVYSLFHWNDGSFEFLEGDSSREKISVKTSMMNLILEGTRRLDEWSQVRERIQNDQIVLSPHKSVAEAGGKVKLSNPERRVLGLVDGRRTVREVVDVAGLGEFEAWQALNALLSAGFIRVQLLAFDQPEAAEDKAAAPGDDSALDLTMDRYGEAVVEILGRAEQAGMSDVVARVRKRLREATFKRVDLLREVAIEPDGRIDRHILLANVAEDPPGDRARNLEAALESMLRLFADEFKGKVQLDDVLAALRSGGRPPSG